MSRYFGGVQHGQVAYCVGEFPGMKRTQLYRSEGGAIKPVAGFRSDEDAREFGRWLNKLADMYCPFSEDQEDPPCTP